MHATDAGCNRTGMYHIERLVIMLKTECELRVRGPLNHVYEPNKRATKRTSSNSNRQFRGGGLIRPQNQILSCLNHSYLVVDGARSTPTTFKGQYQKFDEFRCSFTSAWGNSNAILVALNSLKISANYR